MSEIIYSSGQVARMLGIPSRTIRSYLANGRLGASQNPVTGRWHISRQQLEQFMRDNDLEPQSLERQARIFIVERNASRHRMITEALSGHLWHLEVFDSCAKALISMGEAPPDLLILDHWGTEDHCRELIGAIRGHERTATVPVMLLSAPEHTQSQVQPDANVSDPLLPESLREEVENLIQIH